MSRKSRSRSSASTGREIKRSRADAIAALQIIDSKPSERRNGNEQDYLPTVIRRVVSIEPIEESAEIPDVFKKTIEKVSKQRDSSKGTVWVHLFNLSDVLNALNRSRLSNASILDKIHEAEEMQDHEVIDANVSYYRIFGGNNGMSYVGAVLDSGTRKVLHDQSNLIRRNVGVRPLNNASPFHFTLFGSRDEYEAQSVYRQCEESTVKYQIELASPQIRQVPLSR
jgi:hypothetical protein